MSSYTVDQNSGVVTKDDGSVIPQDDTLPAYILYAQWLAAGNSPDIVSSAPISVGRKITVLAFRNRFTASEKVAIELASIDDLSLPMQTRAFKAALRVSQKDLDVALHVDLDRPDTQKGGRDLELYQIIGVGRADEIINAQIIDSERPS